MKKILCILLIGFTITTYAQERKNMHKKHDNNYTPEQKVKLKTKKMTLALDLNSNQQKQVEEVLSKGIKEMEGLKAEKMKWASSDQKPTTDQKFALQEKFLDHQIKMQSEMKKILNEDQYVEWKKMQDSNKKKMMKKRKHKKPGAPSKKK